MWILVDILRLGGIMPTITGDSGKSSSLPSDPLKKEEGQKAAPKSGSEETAAQSSPVGLSAINKEAPTNPSAVKPVPKYTSSAASADTVISASAVASAVSSAAAEVNKKLEVDVKSAQEKPASIKNVEKWAQLLNDGEYAQFIEEFEKCNEDPFLFEDTDFQKWGIEDLRKFANTLQVMEGQIIRLTPLGDEDLQSAFEIYYARKKILKIKNLVQNIRPELQEIQKWMGLINAKKFGEFNTEFSKWAAPFDLDGIDLMQMNGVDLIHLADALKAIYRLNEQLRTFKPDSGRAYLGKGVDPRIAANMKVASCTNKTDFKLYQENVGRAFNEAYTELMTVFPVLKERLNLPDKGLLNYLGPGRFLD